MSAASAPATDPPTTGPATDAVVDPPAYPPAAFHAEPTDPTAELEALVLSLRASLASSQTLITSQSARLVQMGDLETSLSTLKDQLTFAQAAKEALELQLREERDKRERAEESVELLRGQVEQARRGVMQLQKQEKDRKRFSQIGAGGGGLMSPPLSAAGASINAGVLEGGEEGREVGLSANDGQGAAPGQTSRAAKRSSMYARRPVSSSGDDPSAGTGPPSAWQSPVPELSAPRTGASGLRELRLGGSSSSPQPGGSSTSPPQAYFDTPLPVPDLPGTAPSVPMPTTPVTSSSPNKGRQSLTYEEITILQDQNMSLRTALAESQEARAASEHALRALREFMSSSSGIGDGTDPDPEATRELLKGIRLPPLPTDQEHDDVRDVLAASAAGEKKKAAWGFGLFRNPGSNSALGYRGGAGSPTPSTAVEPPATPGSKLSNLSPPASVRSGSSPLPTPGELPTESRVEAVPSVQTPLASFVSGWTKSVAPGTPAAAPGAAERPQGGRKLTNFFGLGKKEVAGITSPSIQQEAEGAADGEKALPTPPPLPPRLREGEDGGNVVDLTFDAEHEATQNAQTPKLPHSGAETEMEGVEGDLETAAMSVEENALGLSGKTTEDHGAPDEVDEAGKTAEEERLEA